VGDGKNGEDKRNSKMIFFKNLIRILSSRLLTLWLLFGFILYYLTVSVWFGEAFGRYVNLIAKNNLARFIYIIFFINILIRITRSVLLIKSDRVRLFLKMPIYAGIILFLLFSFLDVNLRQIEWTIVIEGDTVTPPWEGDSYRIIGIEPALKKDVVRIDDSQVFDYEPHVRLMDAMTGEIHRIGAFPARKIKKTYMHILNFGIAPVIELKDGNTILAEGPVIMRLIPFGSIDTFEINKYNYKIYMHILPNNILKKGDLIGRDYSIEHPLYHLQVLKGDRIIFDGSSTEEVTFEGKVLRFYKPIYWVQLELVKDPVYPFFLMGLSLTIIGLVLYPFGLWRGSHYHK